MLITTYWPALHNTQGLFCPKTWSLELVPLAGSPPYCSHFIIQAIFYLHPGTHPSYKSKLLGQQIPHCDPWILPTKLSAVPLLSQVTFSEFPSLLPSQYSLCSRHSHEQIFSFTVPSALATYQM